MNIVYSSEKGEMCPNCGHSLNQCQCHKKVQGPVRLQIEKRRGKPVTLVKNLPLSKDAIKSLGQKLRKALGVGGVSKTDLIEFQGDVRDRLRDLLEKEGLKCR